MHLIVDMRR